MSIGRRDYTWGFLNESAVEGRYGETFVKAFGMNIDAGENEYLYLYTVPAGYKLSVNRIDVSTNSRVVNVMGIGMPPAAAGNIFFSDNYSYVFSDQNPLVRDAGETIFVTANNQDEITRYFYGILTGVLQSLIP